MAAFATIGLTPSRLRNEGRGMAAVEQRIDYRHELYAGDIVTVRSTVLEIRDKSIRFIHEMLNDDTGIVAATTVIVAVHLDAAARKARSLPVDVWERWIAMTNNETPVDPPATEGVTGTDGSGTTLSAAVRT